ncbi:MAG: hypothetical protein ABSF26_18325 [Thermoguttaceae bacterium]|jgi:hypothetical protein
MTRRSLSNILSGEQQSLQKVWGWYEFQRALIGEETSRVLDAPRDSASLAKSRYVGKTPEELEADFADQIAELGRVTMLGILASTEAALRVDFIERVSRRKKDDVSRGFRDAFKEHGKKIRLEEDILDVWRKHGDAGIRQAVQEFKGALKLRDWLAHGRYWKPKLGRVSGYDLVDVFDICRGLLQATGSPAG